MNIKYSFLFVIFIFTSNFIFAQLLQENTDTVEVEKVFDDTVERMPRFPGCEDLNVTERKKCSMDTMLSYIYSELEYPILARKHNIQGTVVITFTVSKSGEIIDARITRDIGGGCGAEALRVMESMPDWHNALQRGKPVSVTFNMPINFALKKEKKRKKSKRKKKGGFQYYA